MRLLLALALGLFINTVAFSQVLKPVKWSTDYKQISDNEFDLIYIATIKDGWSIYSQYLESDDGPVRTSFEYDAGDHFSLSGKNKEEGNKKEGFDALFDMNVIKFDKSVTFTQRVKATDLSKPITGYLTFMTCDKSRCLPPTDVDFEFKLESKTKSAAGDSGATTPKEEIKKVESTVKTEASQTPKIEKPEPPKKANSAVSSVKETVDKTKDKISSAASTASTAVQSAKDKVQDKAEEVKTQIASKAEAATDQISIDLGSDDNSGGSKLLDPVKWKFNTKKTGADEYEVQFIATLDKGWTIYSQFTADDGPVPTAFTFDEGDHYELLGKATEDGKKKEGPDPLFDNVNVIKYVEGNVVFTQKVKVTDTSKPLSGFLTYMTCDKKQCLPPKDVDFWIDPASTQSLLGAAASEKIDQLTANANPTTNTIASSSSAKMNLDGNVLDNKIPKIRETYVNPIGDCGKEDIADDQSLFWTFVMGFAGGLLALLTPCVFPMIPLTVSFFTKGSKDRASGIKNGLIYGLSIIAIYVTIGLVITGLFGATALNELSTNWIANTLFFAIFIFFAISFFGYFEITLPSSWTNKSDAMADKGGLLGTFFMAFTLALVSFSCTGPIIGSALVQSATNALGPFTVMLGFSSALALPFGLFAAFPAWLNSLPRSGSWMNSVKVVLGFLELALALKFLSVADMTMHWGILGYEIFLGLWIVIFAAMTLYLFGFIKFPHDSPVHKLSIPRIGFGLASLAWTIYLCTGFMFNDKTMNYNSLSLMSGLAPPAYYNYFLPEAPETTPNPEIKKRYASFTKCANNLDCFKDYYEGLSYAKETNKPILLDFTGYGCVNCRKTEEHIWIVDDIWEKINDDYVLISLYVDDRKKLEQMLISKNTKEKLRNIGNKWADFQIVNFEQNSQPLYVMMTPDEEVLAKPRGFIDDVQGYSEFLDCGLQTFKGHSQKLGAN